MEILGFFLVLIAIGVGGLVFFGLGAAAILKGIKHLLEWIFE